MNEILKTYCKLGPKKKVFAEILIYAFIAFNAQNKSGIEISKSVRETIDGKRTVKYEIEVTPDD
ncbi:hypothetical protein P7H46_06595 [Enterococcus pseudoavium]|uniref:Uncharacterized protein n=1 Tax=Enterococcus pseudoavium TaxID=44007 RepID=A0ABU3FHI2_9ENTE|nr:hypothetical protein [Enterococcus pseudoavium]MDT2770512.1 hypothetical protein [Enterococcus pseudoavium]